jgi:hypothetical protein
MARLTDVLKDLFGLGISEGALVNILSAACKSFATQTSLINARLPVGNRVGVRRNRYAGRQGQLVALGVSQETRSIP